MLAIALVYCRHGSRRPLDDQATVEVWSPDHRLLGTLPGTLVIDLIRSHVHAHTLRQAVSQALTGAKKPGARVAPPPRRALAMAKPLRDRDGRLRGYGP